MARTKYGFEKRQKEKARQQKQLEKAARKKEARQRKAETDPESQVGGMEMDGLEADVASVAEEEQPA